MVKLELSRKSKLVSENHSCFYLLLYSAVYVNITQAQECSNATQM